MNASAVTVVGDILGNVVNVSQNNPEYGYVRLQQSHVTISDKGWLKINKRSTLIKGKVSDLIAANFIADSEIPGKIVIIESHEPFNKENPERDLKIAGQTGIVCRVGDQPIYRQTFYTTDENAQDVLIAHDNSDEIKGAIYASKEVSLNVVESSSTNFEDSSAINDVF